MLTNTILLSILREFQEEEFQAWGAIIKDAYPVLVDGAIVKQIRFDEKVQMLILDTEEIELENGQHILWSAE